MSETLGCPNCGDRLRVPEYLADNRTAICPKCLFDAPLWAWRKYEDLVNDTRRNITSPETT